MRTPHMLVYIDIRYFRKPDEHKLMQERDVTALYSNLHQVLGKHVG